MSKLSTDPYKGVRDFYPEDMFVLKHMFSVFRKVCEKYGYTEYTASPLEPAELYRAKSGEEIVNEQTYTFKDRGDREVTLRPEMTPTVARMVAGKRRELGFPLRWYSIPNLFRYENPQRGRLREHYQLNVDVFGLPGIEGEVEILSITSEILKSFGATENDFVILINSKELLRDFFSIFGVDDKNAQILTKIIDKKNKVDKGLYEESLEKILKDKTKDFLDTLGSSQKFISKLGENNPCVQKLIVFIKQLEIAGINNVEFTPTLMRGFDYYTDIVFEVYDSSEENRRSIFGGGRYDNLTKLFDNDDLAAVGIAIGDVTLRDFLLTHNLLPKYESEVRLCIGSVDEKENPEVILLANNLRKMGVNVATDTILRKIGDKIKATTKLNIPYFLAVGEDELKKKLYKVKNLETGEEKELSVDQISEFINK